MLYSILPLSHPSAIAWSSRRKNKTSSMSHFRIQQLTIYLSSKMSYLFDPVIFISPSVLHSQLSRSGPNTTNSWSFFWLKSTVGARKAWKQTFTFYNSNLKSTLIKYHIYNIIISIPLGFKWKYIKSLNLFCLTVIEIIRMFTSFLCTLSILFIRMFFFSNKDRGNSLFSIVF